MGFAPANSLTAMSLLHLPLNPEVSLDVAKISPLLDQVLNQVSPEPLVYLVGRPKVPPVVTTHPILRTVDRREPFG